jgi:hypothetical protein
MKVMMTATTKAATTDDPGKYEQTGSLEMPSKMEGIK